MLRNLSLFFWQGHYVESMTLSVSDGVNASVLLEISRNLRPYFVHDVDTIRK